MESRLYRNVILGVALALSALFLFAYGRNATTFYGDDAGYYWLLPATFIYHNHDSLEKLPPDPTLPGNVTWYASRMESNGWRTPTGKILIQYTYGVALMEAPFFLLAHGTAKAFGLEDNGFTGVYVGAIKLCTIFYAALGLWLLYRTLRRHFTRNVSLTGLTLLLLCTNLFWFAFHQAGMAHVPLFFLYAMLMHLTVRVLERPKTGLFAAMGLVVGIIILIRPTDIVCLAIPLLYGVYNRATALHRIGFIRRHLPQAGLAAVIAALPYIPQMLYWNHMAGSYLYYSYGGQEFHWLHPKIIEGLFLWQNGWLAYSPVMALSILGLLLWRRFRPWVLCTVLLLPVYIWITYAWFCFNYINGLGSRPMIHLYPLLVFPLTAVVAAVADRGKGWKAALAVFALLCLTLNMNWSVQQSLGILKSEESNLAFNASIFFRDRLRYNDLVVRDNSIIQPDAQSLRRLETVACRDYADSLTDRYIRDTSAGGTHAGYFYRMGDEEWLDDRAKIQLRYSRERFKDVKWMRASGRFLCTQWPGYFKHHLFLVVKRDGKEIRGKRCMIINKIGISDRSCEHADTLFTLDHEEVGRWGPVWYYVDLPKDIRDGDEITLDIWNPGHQEMFIDDLCLELYE